MLDWNYEKGDWNTFKKVFDEGLKNWYGARIWSNIFLFSMFVIPGLSNG